MKYVVYNKKTGEIVRTYRKILAESGEAVPAKESEILADLPRGLTQEDVGALPMQEFPFERGKTYRVDPGTRQIIGEPNKR